jgi:hypothetical protein
MRIEGSGVPVITVVFLAISCMACSCDGPKQTGSGATVPRRNIEGLTINKMQNGDEMFASADAATVDDNSVLKLDGDALVSGQPSGSSFLAICKCKEGKYHVISYGVQTFKLGRFSPGHSYQTAASLLIRHEAPQGADVSVLFDGTKPVGNGKKPEEVKESVP